MGQRLVVTVRKSEEDICKIYYHWSAYTMSALNEAQKIVDAIYNGEDETTRELQLRLIRFCEENGGGIDGGCESAEGKYIQSIFPKEQFKDDVDRSYGLIALSEQGMENMQNWSEGDLTINLDEERIYNDVMYCYDDNEEEFWENHDWFDEDDRVIETVGYDISEFDIGELDDVIRELKEVKGFLVRDGYCIYELIA